MGLRWLGGLFLCVSLAGCVRISPAFGGDDTDTGGGGSAQPTMTSGDSVGGTSGETAGNSGTSQGSTVGSLSDSNGDEDDPHGSSETTDAATGSSDEGPDPVDCVVEADCGPGHVPCPEGFVCNAYTDPSSGDLRGGCFEIGPAQRGEACDDGCGDIAKRCDEGLVCTSWRDAAICLDRCTGNKECGPDVCDSPKGLAGFVGACVAPASCDLLAQDCSKGDMCIPTDKGDATQCVPSAGDGTTGDSCEFSNQCAPSHICADAELCGDNPCCLLLCDQQAKVPVCSCDDLGIVDQPSAGVCTTMPK